MATITAKTKTASTAIGILVLYSAATTLALVVPTALTIGASLLICAGLHPESMSAAEIAAPLIGLFWAGLWIGARSGRPYLAGFALGVLTVLIYFITYLYLQARWDIHEWMRLPVSRVAASLLTWYAAATSAAIAGGGIGGRSANRRWVALYALALAPVLLAIVMTISTFTLPASLRNGATSTLANGVTLQCTSPDTQGTIVRLLTFDLRRNPKLRIRLYDVDTDDPSPGNDVNTTYVGTPVDYAMARLPISKNETVLSVFNAGFFGWGPHFRGMHVAPVVIDGKPLYNVPPDPKWWTFGISKSEGNAQFHLVQGLVWGNLHEFDTAIVHVRPLIVNGKAPSLKPGAGVTALRCSRASIGWTKDSGKFYVLIVRDPDGEMSSVLQMKEGRQTGGFDLRQLQAYWKRLCAYDAVALDGGDSTQLAYLESGRGYRVIRSGYQASVTLGHLRGRPVRLFLPMLPPSQDHNGVMNYLYVTSD